MTDVIGYIRVSTDEQADSGAGLDAQRSAIAAEAERRGWRVIEVIADAGFSGKDLKRPGIVAALDALKRGKADSLVVAKLDRLSRSMLDFAGLMDRATKEGWSLVALDLGVDTTTPSGEMMANVLATFAVFERRLISQRTRAALAAKRCRGVRLGRPRSLPDHVVRRIANDRRSGLTLQHIADRLNADGVATAQGGAAWHASTVGAVVRSLRHDDDHQDVIAALNRPTGSA